MPDWMIGLMRSLRAAATTPMSSIIRQPSSEWNGLGTRRSEQLLDLVRVGDEDHRGGVFPLPSHDYGSPPVYYGHMTGGGR